MKKRIAIVALLLLFVGSIVGLPLKFVKDATSRSADRVSEEEVIPYGDYYHEEIQTYSGVTNLAYKSNEESNIRVVTLSTVHFSTAPSMSAENAEEIVIPDKSYEEMYVAIDLVDAYLSLDDNRAATTYTFGQKLEGKMVDEDWFEFTSNEETLYISADALMTQDEFLGAYQYLLAQALYSEAGGVSKAEMTLVGEVILNRLRTTYWEFANVHTIEQVLAQSGQYPTTWWKIQNGLRPSEDAMEVAEELLLGTAELSLTEDSYWQTGFFPTWDVEVILVTEYHWYARLAT